MTDVSSPKSANSGTDISALLRLPIEYWKQTVAVLAAIVVIAGGYALFTLYQKSQSAKAEQALSELTMQKTGAELVDALQKMATTAPSSVRAAVNLELAKAAQTSGDFAKAADAWEAVAKDAPESMRIIARLGQATALTQAGQNDKALAVLEALKANAPKEFQMTVDRQLAVTAEAAGQWQKALDAYNRMKADGSLQNPGYIDARIAAVKAKADAAATPKTNG